MRRFPLVIALGVLPLFGCESGTTNPTPTGVLRILMRTEGKTLDSDGYSYRLGPYNIALAVQDSQDVRDLSPGRMPAGLSGLASNCRAFSYGPDSITILSSDTSTVSLVVSCDSALRSVILYEHWLGPTSPEIWIMRPDGTGKSRFLANAWFPGATPNGTRVIYSDWNTGKLSIMRADGRYVGQVVPTLAGAQYRHDVSPDGQSVVFEKTSGEPVRLYRANLDGTGIIELTHQDYDSEPRWSPDGRFITYTGINPAGGDVPVFRIPSEGGDPVQLTTDGVCCARWSPLGDQVLFAGPYGFWTMAPDGSNAAALDSVPPGAYGDWSPDGTQLVIERVTDSLTQIWRVPLQGGAPIQLTSEGQNLLGRWLP
jgi:hypothetical protein